MSLGNLRDLANSQTSVVNDNVPATLMISTGNTVDSNYKQIPSYDSSPVFVQVQPVSTGDIRQLDALNIQGVQKVAYVDGVASAINRIKNFGGDLLVFSDGIIPEGNTWLIKANLEQWSNTWCKVALVLQDD